MISLDASGRRPGRGAYLCRDAACWDLAARKRALEHAFKAPVPDALLASLATLAADPAVGAATNEPAHRAATGAPNHDNHEGGPHGSK